MELMGNQLMTWSYRICREGNLRFRMGSGFPKSPPR